MSDPDGTVADMTETKDPFKLPSQMKGLRYKNPGDFERSQFDSRPYVYAEDGSDNGKLYTRITTFIDCLSDRTQLEKWRARIILTGLAVEHRDWLDAWLNPERELVSERSLVQTLVEGYINLDDRSAMNELVEAAFRAGDGYLKAEQGTDMHRITEAWDRMEPLPEMGEWEQRDFEAWLRLMDTHKLVPVDIERRCVIDELKVAGTPDRTYWWPERNELVIGDLKTGSIDYGAGKMAMQLALAAHGKWYDPDTYERSEMGVSQTHGLIIRVPNGEGTATLYVADLVEGWRGVTELARPVREWRNTSKKLLTEVSPPLLPLLEKSVAMLDTAKA